MGVTESGLMAEGAEVVDRELMEFAYTEVEGGLKRVFWGGVAVGLE